MSTENFNLWKEQNIINIHQFGMTLLIAQLNKATVHTDPLFWLISFSDCRCSEEQTRKVLASVA